MIPAVVLALPLAAGLLGLLLPAFGLLPALGQTRLSLEAFGDLLATPGIGRSVATSFGCGLAATALSVGATLSLLSALAGTRALETVRRCLGPLIAVPHAAAAFGLAFLVAPSGLALRLAAGPLGLAAPPDMLLVNDPLGLAMVAGLAIKELPFLLVVSFAALPQVEPKRRLRLAASLGYGRAAGFALGLWPVLYRQIRLPVLAVAAYSSSVVDVAIILGPQAPPPLAVRLVQWMGDPDLSLRLRASAGALLQLGVTGATILAWIAGERLCSLLRRAVAEAGFRLSGDRALRMLLVLPAVLSGLGLGGGLVALLLWSLAGPWFFPAALPAAWTLRTWTSVLASAEGPLGATLAIALVSTAIALVLAVAMLRLGGDGAPSRAGVALLSLPLVVPQVAFVFGLQVAALQAGLAPGPALVTAAHLVFVLPYVALASIGPWGALDRRYERIAAGLGASRLRVFLRVRLPLMRPALAAAFAIGFAVSVGQYLPTLLLGQGRVPTITTEAVALGAGGNRRLIGAYALLQALPPCLVFALAALMHARPARRGA